MWFYMRYYNLPSYNLPGDMFYPGEIITLEDIYTSYNLPRRDNHWRYNYTRRYLPWGCVLPKLYNSPNY